MNHYRVTDNTDPMFTMITSIQDIYHQIFPLSPNFRPLAIFSGYLILATALALSILYTIYSQSQLPSKAPVPKAKVLIFGVLAVLSLGITWFHMISFFDLSYTTWASSNNVHVSDVQLGSWLKDTQLLEQAWGTVCLSPARYWWTHQIFLYATIWSLFVGHEGKKYEIPGLWRFVLLGEVVAISFASCLFFMTLLCSSTRNSSKFASASVTLRTTNVRTKLLLISLFCYAICIHYLPKTVNTPYFLPLLALPHIILYFPLYIDQPSQTFYNNLVTVMLYFFVALQAKVTRDVKLARELEAGTGELKGMDGFLSKTFSEHPAVASVGSDAMACIISFGVWQFLEGWF